MDRNSPVRDIMTVDVLAFGPDDGVEQAMRALLARNIDAAPVVDADGVVLGMLSNGDLIVQESELHFPTVMTFLGGTFEFGHKQFDEELRRALGSKVSDVMSTKPLVCESDDTIERAATIMHEHDVSRLPVVEAGKLVGIVSRNDVLRAILEFGLDHSMEKAVEVHPDDRPYAWADVDLGAIEHNAGLLAARAAPAALCAVVKGWGYGHGIVRSATAAVERGATWLGVALVNEAVDVRAQLAEPVLVLAEPPLRQLVDVARLPGVRPTVYRAEAIRSAAKAVRDVGRTTALPVHLKVDTGMHRVGAAPQAALHLAELIAESEELELEGLWTHLAASEDPSHDDYTARQLGVFEEVRAQLAAAGLRPPIVHAANSGGVLAHPEARYDLVRCGIAIYGIAPRQHMPQAEGLREAMSLKARVSYVKRVDAGEPISYGLHHTCDRPTVVATVPIGYYDGVPRRLGMAGGEVLIWGRRRRILGAVTMDQLMVECGDDETVRVRDEVVLFGSQGDETISAWEWAERLDTIAYEIVCGIAINRVPRRYSR